MAWEQLSIDKPHLVYIILGGFTSLFMLCSLVIKEKLYIGEATVATICGVIFGPHGANLINPFSWGNTDKITLEFSRIVLVVQCFAVGVELPKAYMERHWKSVVFLLLPVMTFGWLMTSVFIWWMIVPLTWLEALACAACVTATDPVLASSVVGKGKFAKRVPKHLRDVLSAESGCNDGMAFPFIYLSIYLLRYRPNAGQVIFHWTCFTILYECVFGAFYGFMIGYIARHLIKYSERKSLIDRESFLVFYFTLALFCAGSGSMLGMDDLLIGFSAGVGFSNDGWFTEKTEESHVSNVIDLLLNLAYFVYLGTIIPWNQYNNPSVGLTPWRLSVIAIFVILFRRIPIMMALKPIIPDIKTWREALFAGHFGPIGVGAIFAAILARAELETESTDPLATVPSPGTKDYELIYLIWPVTTFLVISSILVHGSSIAVFTLGRRINTLTLTFSYTQDNESGPGWMNRLPRISSQSRSMSKGSLDSYEKPELPPGVLLPTGMPGTFLRRQREEDAEKAGSRPGSVRSYRRKKKWDGAGGPISQSAIAPQRQSEPNLLTQESGSDTLNEKSWEPSPESHEASIRGERTAPSSSRTSPERGQVGRQRPTRRSTDPTRPADVEVYEEGHELIVEDTEGNVLATVETRGKPPEEKAAVVEAERNKLSHETSGEHAKFQGETHGMTEGEELEHELGEAAGHPERKLRKQLDKWRGWGQHKDEKEEKAESQPKPPSKSDKPERRRGPAHAYQFGNTIIVEDEDGEVMKKYTIPAENKQRSATAGATDMRRSLKRMGTWVGVGGTSEQHAAGDHAANAALAEGGVGNTDKNGALEATRHKGAADTDSDDGLRLTVSHADRYGLTGRLRDDGTINTSGRRMSTKDFIKQMQQLDPKTKIQAVNESDTPEDLKQEIRRQVREEKGDRDPGQADGRKRAGTMPSSRPHIRAAETTPTLGQRPEAARRADTELPPRRGYDGSRPEPLRTRTEETIGSDDASDEGVPTYDITATLARHSKGSTAAESRRQRLAKDPSHEGGGDDSEQAETAAEKRRRLAALGVGGGDEEDSSSDEDVDAPRRPKEEKEPVPEPSRQRPRVQWGGESGRERGREREKETRYQSGGLKGIFGGRPGS
jgi:NhaP-type Na+/H+ or K+/H+ antiporter